MSGPLWLALALLVAVGIPARAFAEDGAKTSCIQCHGSSKGSSNAASVQIVQEHEDSVHAEVGLSCHDCHGGNPAPELSGDVSAAMSPEFAGNSYRGVPTRLEIPGFCGRCHSDPVYMKRFKPDARVDQEQEYWTSRHGELLRRGDGNVATCVDCHGAHRILRPSNPSSPVYPTRLAEMCGGCHSDAERMRGYTTSGGDPLPFDQYERWTHSVHAEALLREGDLSAPTCNDCHGNHGAAPPGLESVIFVCGQCHGREASLLRRSGKHDGFQKHNDDYLSVMDGGGCRSCHDTSPLAEVTDVHEFSECATCHGSHAVIRATMAMLAPLPTTPCAFCHEGTTPVAEIYQEAGRTERRYVKVRDELLAEAESKALNGDERFDWLVEQSQRLSVHRLTLERRGARDVRPRPGFQRLFRKFRVGKTQFTYQEMEGGEAVRVHVTRCTGCHRSGADTDDGQATKPPVVLCSSCVRSQS